MILSVALGMMMNVFVSSFIYNKEGWKCTLDSLGKEFCFADNRPDEEGGEEDRPMFYNEVTNEKEKERLFIWDPVRVGYEREIDLGRGNKVKMVTKSLRPKVFTIENFLTDEEADYIVYKAKQHGVESSNLHLDFKMQFALDTSYGAAHDTLQSWDAWDHNKDGNIVMSEIIETAREVVTLYYNSSNVKDMFATLNLTELDDGVITEEEFKQMDMMKLGSYMNNIRQNHPVFRDRYSNQIWLRQSDPRDRVLANLREKVIKLTNLPRYIVEGGEPLQVLNYQPHGHYHAHYDGQDFSDYPNTPCCHLSLSSQPNNCMMCRLLTIIYYLNDVDEGGETAFPVADKRGFTEERFRKRILGDLYNLSEFCHNASLVVKPKKRRAVLFYNQFLDRNGWMGKMDRHSLHGGCNIIKGEKWMANNWITAPPSKDADKDSIYSFMTPTDSF